MTQERMQRILSEPSAVFGDWTANIIEDATIDDLDPDAIRMAREKYTERHEIRAKEIESWDDATFLNKAKITRAGKITNAAIILWVERNLNISCRQPYVSFVGNCLQKRIKTRIFIISMFL